MIRKYEALAILGCFVIFAGVLIGCGAKEKKNLTGSTASSITTTGGGGGTTGGTATSQTTSQAAASATNTGVDSLTSVKTALSQLSGSSPSQAPRYAFAPILKNGAPFLATAEWVKPTKDADGYYVLPSYTAPDGTVFQQLVKPDPDWWAMWDNVDATSKPTMPWDLLNENDDFTSTFSMKGSFDGPDAIGAMTMVNKEIKKVKVYSFTFTYSYPSWNEETQKMVMVETTSVSTWKGLDWDNFTSSITGSGKTTNKKDSSWMEFTMTGTGTHTGVPVKDANGFQTGGTFTEKQTETMNFTMSSGYSGKFDMSVEASGSWNQATGGSGIGKGTITGSIYYQGTEICRIYATGQGESKETATVEGYYTLADDGFVTKYPMEEDDIKAIIIGPGGGKSKASIKMSVIKPQN